MNEITKDKKFSFVSKSKLYSCFMNLKKEFKFNDAVNEYLDCIILKLLKLFYILALIIN